MHDESSDYIGLISCAVRDTSKGNICTEGTAEVMIIIPDD